MEEVINTVTLLKYDRIADRVEIWHLKHSLLKFKGTVMCMVVYSAQLYIIYEMTRSYHG